MLWPVIVYQWGLVGKKGLSHKNLSYGKGYYSLYTFHIYISSLVYRLGIPAVTKFLHLLIDSIHLRVYLQRAEG